MAPAALSLAWLLSACGPSGWTVLETLDPRTLRDVFVDSQGQVTAVGDRHRITDYDGRSITETSFDLDPELALELGISLDEPSSRIHAVSGGPAGRAFAGDLGLLLTRAEDGRWSRDDGRTGVRLYTLLHATPSILYAAGESGVVLRKGVNDRRWTRVEVRAPASARITASWASGAQRVAFATHTGSVIERVGNDWVTDVVKTRTATTPVPLFGIWSATTSADLVVVGLGGAIYRRPRGSHEWNLEPTPTNQDIYGIHGTAPDRVFAVGARGTILRYDGEEWRSESSPTSEDLFAVHGSPDGRRTVAVGARGFFVLRED